MDYSVKEPLSNLLFAASMLILCIIGPVILVIWNYS